VTGRALVLGLEYKIAQNFEKIKILRKIKATF